MTADLSALIARLEAANENPAVEGGASVGRKIGRPKARPLVKPCGKENLIYPSAAQAVLRAKQGEG